MIVAEQMQQAVQRQDPELGELGVPCLAGLPTRDAARDDDVSQKTGDWPSSRQRRFPPSRSFGGPPQPLGRVVGRGPPRFVGPRPGGGGGGGGGAGRPP